MLSNCDEYTKQFYSDHGFGGSYTYYTRIIIIIIIMLKSWYYCDSLDTSATVDTPKVIEKKEISSVENIPVCHDDNILNKLLSQSEIEALVFKAKIVLKEPDNLNREFIVKCFLSDQSFSVSETKIQTAGEFYE